MYFPPRGIQRPVSRLNALRRAASSGCPGAAGLGTREASRQYTAFETSSGRRDVAARRTGKLNALNATKRGRRRFTYSDRGS